MHDRKLQNGFTLVELSIVLVIIGLIIGGVLVARDLIYVAKMRKVASEYQSYESVYNTFKNKFNCLPGDCKNAADFGFGTSGDGDGKIWPYETRYVCEQLKFAQLVVSTCSGGFPSGINVYPNRNALPSSYRDVSLVEMTWVARAAPYTENFTEANYVVTQMQSPEGNWYPLNGFSQGGMLPRDARWIDIKIDNGAPLSGKFLQFSNYVCGEPGDVYTSLYTTDYICESYYLVGR